MEIFLDALLDALIDGVKMLPFLYLAYLLIEWLERHHGENIENALAGGGRWGFLPGALLGCVPQCGFSAVASNFYASRVITPGTLLAVFIATSDEAIPLLAAEPSQWTTLVLLIVCKIIFAIVGGVLLDFPLRKVLPHSLYGGYEGHADEVDCHEEHEETSSIFLAALRHTLEIFVFILLFSFLIGLIFESVGEDAITGILGGMGIFQPMLTALVGLVPNCAASVLLAQLYMEGAITFGSLFAGLTAGAGVGLAVLWRVNPSWKQNLFMTGLLWAVLLAGQAVPGLDADKVQRLFGGGPDQHVGVALHVANHAAAGVLLHNGDMGGLQVDHAMAVTVEQVVGQGDGLGVAGQIVTLAIQQAVGNGADAQRGLQPVKADLVILGGMAVIKGQRKGGVIADAKAQLLLHGVLHSQGVVDGLAVQHKSGAQH